MAVAATDPQSRPIIAVDVDDTLNDFTETLRRSPFPYHPRYGLPLATFERHLATVREGTPDPSDLLSSEYSLFRYRIHEECYATANARGDGVEFMRWLRACGWRIVICTRRDLRRAGGNTKSWLSTQGIPFDYLFSAFNKIAFCRAWDISILVDDDPNSIQFGEKYGVRVFYPVGASGSAAPSTAFERARGFQSFAEVRRWIQESA